jgi:hypothetical protein
MGAWGCSVRTGQLSGGQSTGTPVAILSYYGILFYVTSLRVWASGMCRFCGIEATYPVPGMQETVVTTCRDLSEDATGRQFLRVEKDDGFYLEGLGADRATVARNWREL